LVCVIFGLFKEEMYYSHHYNKKIILINFSLS
jgi:hypothetical protein